ncbi:MAG TPA: pantothenate kinase [Rectinemataceae bacterium]|nr:pantothenate kinase [Rectinemataceae bacterium]
MIVGIDIGGSTTKIVGVEGVSSPLCVTVRASDPVASAAGAVGKFLATAGRRISDIERLAVTGVGASFLGPDVLGIEARAVDEFKAIGLGGLRLSGLPRALVVSVGTGTAFVRAEGREVRHVGGSGVGGGTLLGLGLRLAGVSDFEGLVEASREGRLDRVDLTIGDISSTRVGSLPADATASNFGKVLDGAEKSDLAAGVVNLVFQAVGMIAIMAARAEACEDIVMVGKSMRLPMATEVLEGLSALYGTRFLIPDLADYGTALGAAFTLV